MITLHILYIIIKIKLTSGVSFRWILMIKHDLFLTMKISFYLIEKNVYIELGLVVRHS